MKLIERERDLELLEIWLREAAAGTGRLVFLGGESGIGKTSLVNQFCQEVQDRARILRGSCDALSTPRPLGPLHDMAAGFTCDLSRLLVSTAPRDQVFRAVLTDLRESPAPTVCIVEDAHWADEATLDLLRFVGRRIGETRLLLIVTFRDDEVNALHPWRQVMGDLATTPGVRRMHLQALSGDGIRSLATGSTLDPEMLYRLTGGNPFYASEVLADQPAKIGAIPATVRDAVIARAARLSPEARMALEAAAVIGSLIDVELLSEVAETAFLPIEECLAHGMLLANGNVALAFRHELARTAIRDAISPLRRRRLHGRVLTALQARPESFWDMARLAHHAEAAGDGEAVLRFAPEAGRRAASLRAHREAVGQYARALRFAMESPPHERASLLDTLSYEYYLTGRPEEAIACRRQALEIWRALDDRVHVGDGLRWVSRSSWFAGRTGDAVAAADEAISVLNSLPPGRELAMALSNRAQLYMLADETESAIVWGERAIALARALGEPEIELHALNNVGTARMKAGNDQGRLQLERSLEMAQADDMEEHVARALTNLSWSALHVRELARAESYFTAGIAYAADHDLDSWHFYMLSWHGSLKLLTGDWPAAAANAANVLAMPTAGPLSRITAATVQGLLLARRGESGAEEWLTKALALATPTGELQRLKPIRIARAEAAWLAGDQKQATAEVRAVLDLTLRRGSAWDIGEVLLWLRRTGSRDDAADLSRLPAPYRHALTGDWASAAAAWSGLGCPYDAALALLDGDCTAIHEAHRIFDRLGAHSAVAVATRRLRALGARGVPRGPRPSTRTNPAQLTGRELEILPFLADGRSNAEIADRLFISAKTVDHHVGSILAKLGVHARRDVAVAANRIGILFSPGKDRVSESLI